MPTNPLTAPTDRIYVVSQGGGVAGFDAFADGSVRALPGSPYPTGSGTFCVRVSPDRRFLYTASGMGLGVPVALRSTYRPAIHTFRIGEDGTLTEIDTLRLPTFTTPVSFAISADGRNLYLGAGRGLAGFFFGRVQHFRIDDEGKPTSGGDAIRLGKFTDGAVQPVIGPDGKYLYLASVIAKSIVRMRINADGSLSGPVDRTPSSGIFPITPAFSLDGRYFYVANEQSKSLSGFAVADDGSLTELPGSPYPTTKVPHNPVLSKDGRFIYWANTLSHNMTGYEIQEDGGLEQLSSSPYATPPGPAALDRSTDGTWAYLVSSPVFKDGSRVVLSSWRIGPDGSLTSSGHAPAETGLVFADGPSIAVVPA